MIEELKPCPFCGGKASASGRQTFGMPLKDATWGDGSPITGSFYVNCISCGINTMGTLSIGQQTREQAVALWNRRT